MILGKGRAEAISAGDIAKLADQLGCHPADLEAIAEVESGGFGWFPDGRMKILFEKHWFYKHLDGAKRALAVKNGLARKTWIAPKNGGYKEQGTADARYKLLSSAMSIDEEAALRSISMGSRQIMGFNYAMCGFVSAKHMWTRFLDSEKYQLEAFARFLKSKGLVPALRARDFAKIEVGYNGGGLNGEYARRMKAASDKLRAGKWKNYKPGTAVMFDPKATTSKPSVSTAPAPKGPVSSPASGWLAALKALFIAFVKGRRA